MSVNLTPALPAGPSTALAPASVSALGPPAPSGEAPSTPMDAQIARTLASLNRYKWLIALLGLAGLGGGIAASRLVTPSYSVNSTILITSGQGGPDRGPIREEQVLDPQGWIDLLHTSAIMDPVVQQLALYVKPERAADTTAFRGFQINRQAQRFYPGEYTLTVSGARYTLRDKVGAVNEQGVISDSIGRTAGFAWAPSRALLGGDRTIKFRVLQPREASGDLISRFGSGLNRGSNIIFLSLRGTAQEKPAETLNAINDQFVRVATDLKTAKVAASSKALAVQREDAEKRLAAAERAYEQFRTRTIALPSDALAIQGAAGGLMMGPDPVKDNYIASKFSLEALRRDRVQLERVAATLRPDYVPVEAIRSVSIVNTDPAAAQLRSALDDLTALDVQIRNLRRTLQDRTQPLAGILTQRATVANSVVPQALHAYLAQVRQREGQLAGVVSQSTGELQQIPQRTTQQEALRRNLEAQQALFSTLNQRYTEAQLAQQSMAPDVKVLDSAVMPSEPNENTASRMIGLGLAGGLGLGLALALLLDRADRRFRYPTQATHTLGLQILGVVPEVDQSRRQTPERVAQIVEAFRSIRMNVRYAVMPNPRVTLTVTSPSPHDGKSLIASNLALSFAEGGWRTVLVDGDLRRGQLHSTFDLSGGPGLVEYLEGTSLLGEVVQPTHHENLALVATGAKHRRGPELLATPRMQQFIAALTHEFDAVIVDSPPLGAGTDAYAIGTATTNVALVLRRAATDLKLAQAKLQVLDQLPVQVIGAVLNEVEAEAGMYQYFSYDPDYVLVEGDGVSHGEDGDVSPEDGAGRLTPGVGQH